MLGFDLSLDSRNKITTVTTVLFEELKLLIELELLIRAPAHCMVIYSYFTEPLNWFSACCKSSSQF